MADELRVPLAEHFHSIQGEGHHVGLQMHFLRFPGCNVGKEQQHLICSPTVPDAEHVNGIWTKVLKVLPNGNSAKVCTDFTGSHFFCDTDYAVRELLDADDLINETYEDAVCFTGGEPLMHQHKQWFKSLYHKFKMNGTAIHVETSGTIMPLLPFDWLTVSPKEDWKPEAIAKADQIKFLVQEDTHVSNYMDEIIEYIKPDCKVFLSPVFDPNVLNKANLDYALELLRDNPCWRLSCQWHKFLNLR
jgi:organic radical activating enzyme